MAFANFETKEINCKIGYFGPEGCGKTANLHSIFRMTSAKMKTGLFELSRKKNTEFFDFLPLSLGKINDFYLKMHLFSFPLVNLYKTASLMMMRGIDGYVFVTDSRLESVLANFEAVDQLKKIFDEVGDSFVNVPCVFQFNKIDLSDQQIVRALSEEINPLGHASFEAIAIESVGTLETLNAITKKILTQLSLKPAHARFS